MNESTPLPEQVIDTIRELNDFFWMAWSDRTSKYPDNPEWDCYSFNACRSAIISIVLNYIVGFEGNDRRNELERMIVELRLLEEKLRDMT